MGDWSGFWRDLQERPLMYPRSIFVYRNFLRYSNPTICNVMFDTQATRPQYDRLYSVVS